MADVKEQNLSSKSSLTVSDYLRVVGSDDVSYKQLVSDVAKKIIENYAGSTLAGSAQSVQSAIDALNSKLYIKTYTVNLTANTTVGPYSAYCQQSIANDKAAHGTPVAAHSLATSTNPVSIKFNGNLDLMWIYAGKTGECTVQVLFVK